MQLELGLYAACFLSCGLLSFILKATCYPLSIHVRISDLHIPSAGTQDLRLHLQTSKALKLANVWLLQKGKRFHPED